MFAGNGLRPSTCFLSHLIFSVHIENYIYGDVVGERGLSCDYQAWLHEMLQREVSVRKARELTRHDAVQMRWMSGVRANSRSQCGYKASL